MWDMSTTVNPPCELSPHQRALREKCFHPTGRFVEFAKGEIEQSIPKRFENICRRYPERAAVRTPNQSLTYAELNRAANRVSLNRHVVAAVVAGHQAKNIAEPELERILAELESMPEEKARQLLAHRTMINTTGKPNE